MTSPARLPSAGRTSGISWPAATWTLPFVPGLVAVLVVGGSRGEGQSRVTGLVVVLVALTLGLATAWVAPRPAWRGVGAGLLAGAVASGLLLLLVVTS